MFSENNIKSRHNVQRTENDLTYRATHFYLLLFLQTHVILDCEKADGHKYIYSVSIIVNCFHVPPLLWWHDQATICIQCMWCITSA